MDGIEQSTVSKAWSELHTYLDRNELMEPETLAKYLGITVYTLAAWRVHRRMDLPYIKVGRMVRYRVRDVLDFLGRRLVNANEAGR